MRSNRRSALSRFAVTSVVVLTACSSSTSGSTSPGAATVAGVRAADSGIWTSRT
jgi:hypothetical protein